MTLTILLQRVLRPRSRVVRIEAIATPIVLARLAALAPLAL